MINHSLAKADVEEAVARARLDWLKRLPEMGGGAHRESVDQLGTGVGSPDRLVHCHV